MIGSRFKKLAIVAGAGALATASTLALSPFSASAAVTTTTTVTAPAATTGHAVKFTAKVSPSKTTSAPVTKATGNVTFTITGSNSSSVPCVGKNPAPITTTGRAFCKVASGALTASDSPYSVTATYSGGNGFGGSTGNMTETIGLAPTVVKVTDDGPPATHTASTFTATVSGSSAAGAPTGTVTFIVTAKPHGKLVCQAPGGKTQPLEATDSTPPQMAATCTLPTNWLKLKKATKSDPNPQNSWTVTAIYNGNGSYAAGSYGTKSGIAKS
jgi:hypothetical protein